MTAPPMSITVRIDRLVIHGVEPGERQSVADALHARLVEVVTDRLRSGDAVQKEPGHRVSVVAMADASPADVGRSAGSAMAGVLFDRPETRR
jgi:hypothetical protein